MAGEADRRSKAAVVALKAAHNVLPVELFFAAKSPITVTLPDCWRASNEAPSAYPHKAGLYTLAKQNA